MLKLNKVPKKREVGAMTSAILLIPMGVSLIEQAQYFYGIGVTLTGIGLLIYSKVFE